MGESPIFNNFSLEGRAQWVATWAAAKFYLLVKELEDRAWNHHSNWNMREILEKRHRGEDPPNSAYTLPNLWLTSELYMHGADFR